MPTPDNDQLTNAPHMAPDRDDVALYQNQKKHAKAKAKQLSADVAEAKGGGSGNAAIYVLALFVVAALGWAGYLQSELLKAQERVSVLEQRLSVTDESVNQSSVALQVKLKDVDTSLTQVRDETLKKYKALLDQHGAQIDSLDKSLKNDRANFAKIDQRVGEQDKALDGARAQLDKVVPLADASKRKLDEHQTALDGLSSKLKSVADAQGKLDSRLTNNEEWVESINTFRKQTNREIVNIKQQIAGGKPPVPAETPVP